MRGRMEKERERGRERDRDGGSKGDEERGMNVSEGGEER